MRWFRVSGILVVVTSLALASACSSIKPVEPDRALQRAALGRWSQCLERFGERFGQRYDGAVGSFRQTTKSVCDGHRRDVIATFPPHLENQVDAILSDRTHVFTTRLVKTGLGKPSPHEARQDDL